MARCYNNSDTADLNERNLGFLEGDALAKEGKTLDDIIPPSVSPERAAGIKEGYNHYLSLAAKDVDESLTAYREEPTVDSFQKVFNSLSKLPIRDSRFLKSAAFLFGRRKMKVKDDASYDLEYWLNRLLAEEFQAWYAYYITSLFLVGEERPHVQESFLSFADDELKDHTDKLLHRIHDLGFTPWLFTPDSWESYSGCTPSLQGLSVDAALESMILAEQCAIESYTQAVNFATSIGDVVSLDLFKAILADEQEHLAELSHYKTDRFVSITDSDSDTKITENLLDKVTPKLKLWAKNDEVFEHIFVGKEPDSFHIIAFNRRNEKKIIDKDNLSKEQALDLANRFRWTDIGGYKFIK